MHLTSLLVDAAAHENVRKSLKAYRVMGVYEGVWLLLPHAKRKELHSQQEAIDLVSANKCQLSIIVVALAASQPEGFSDSSLCA